MSCVSTKIMKKPKQSWCIMDVFSLQSWANRSQYEQHTLGLQAQPAAAASQTASSTLRQRLGSETSKGSEFKCPTMQGNTTIVPRGSHSPRVFMYALKCKFP